MKFKTVFRILGSITHSDHPEQEKDDGVFRLPMPNENNDHVIKYLTKDRKISEDVVNLVNKYMDLYAEHPDELVYKAKAEKYAKIISKTIILSGMDYASFGQNAYFYDSAEGLLTATILLIAEFCKLEERHIVSVFKAIQELLAPAKSRG